MEPVDILTGGYPCQPFSNAGKKLGEDDPRHLWPYIRDAIRILQPRISIFENVSAHLNRGFSSVLRDCAEDGLDVRWCVVRASQAGAPHKRERVFFIVANPYSERLQGNCIQPSGPVQVGERSGVVDWVSGGFQWGEYTEAISQWETILGRAAPYPVEDNANGRPRPRAVFYEWMMGLPEGWVTDPAIGLAWGHQIKMCGNGVVPQQAEFALRLLLDEKED